MKQKKKKKNFGFFYGSEINYFQSSFYDSIEDKKEEKKMDNSTILYMNNNLINSINNITMINELFYNCESLISVQNMAKWNIEYVTEIYGMFANCKSLTFLSDISIKLEYY